LQQNLQHAAESTRDIANRIYAVIQDGNSAAEKFLLEDIESEVES
jgi:hypothetical protein